MAKPNPTRTAQRKRSQAVRHARGGLPDSRANAAADALRLSGPRALLQAVPYLLGFHPVDSLVLVGLRDRHVVVTARMDVADLDTDDRCGRVDGRPPPGSPARLSEPLLRAVGALDRGGVETVVAALWLGADDVPLELSDPQTGELIRYLPREDVVGALRGLLHDAGLELRDALLVAGGRFWSYDCADERCCPGEGTPLDDDWEVPAAATFAGLTALPNRESVASLLDPEPDRERMNAGLAAEERRAVRLLLDEQVATDDRSVIRALFRAARLSEAPAAQPIPDEDVVRYAVALERPSVRDAVWLGVDDRRIDGRPLWRQLARQLPAPYDAAPLFLFGWASWRAGNGTLAGVAAERALASDPGYTAADLLLSSLINPGVGPHLLPRLRSARRGNRPTR